MKSNATRLGAVVSICFAMFVCAAVFTPPPIQAQTYLIRSHDDVPMPFDPYDGAEPIVTIDAARKIYQVQDNTNDWNMLMTAQELDAMSTSSTMSANSIDPGDTNNIGGGGYTNYIQPSIVFGSNDLWIEITNVDLFAQQATLLLHGTVPDEHYQLLSTNILSGDGESWTLGDVQTGAASTNVTQFNTFSIDTNSQMFFRAHHANPEIYLQAGANAIEPDPGTSDPGQIGYITLSSYYTLSNDLPVSYKISGTAQNGIDYSNLTGVVTIPADTGTTNINIVPIADSLIEGAETVMLTLVQSNSYLIDPSRSSETILVEDSSTTVSVTPGVPNAIEPNGPPGEPAVNGRFDFSRSDERGLDPELTIYYVLTGTASNGVDYSLLSGALVFSNGVDNVSLDVIPLADGILEGLETVTLTLVPTNTYLVDTNNSTQTVNLIDTSTTVQVLAIQPAIETNVTLQVGQTGIFQLHRDDTRSDYPPMTVNYQISGTASNGVDYQTLSGTVSFADGATDTNIFIQTLPDDLIEGDETVILTLVTNGGAYYIDTNEAAATNLIQDTVGFLTVVTNLNGPIGIDYYSPSNSLLISYNYNGSGQPFNLARIYTNINIVGGVPVTNVVITNWSAISNITDEVKLATVKTSGGLLTNSAGFTNGDLFFGNETVVGYLSASGTRSNLNWATLTNSTVTDPLPLRGSLYVDQTGVFSNNLIVVASGNSATPDLKPVWRVDAHGHPTLVTNIDTGHLEGVITLTNDVSRWGPWAGKIITGDEDSLSIFTVSTNGAVVAYDTTTFITNGIATEDFDLIPANSALYITAFNNNWLMELPPAYFTNYVGDLLITQAGETGNPGLFVVHWNAVGSNFITTSIPIPDSVGGHIEHVTFAPLQLPGH